MTGITLRIYLPGFAIIFLAVALFWNSFKKFGIVDKTLPNEKDYYNRLNRLHYIYMVALLIFFIMIFLYSFFPKLYTLFLPIAILDHPVINIIGFYILKIALIWTIISQIKLDSRIYKYSLDRSNLTLMEMVFRSEKNVTRGLLTMFVGIVITISNVIGILICVMALSYYGFSNRKRKRLI